MKIINQAKDTILGEDAVIVDSFFRRIRGLLGKKELKKGQALIIKPCNSIHTLFMRFPIDVLFVDKNNRVIKAIPYLKPFRLTYIYFNAAFVVELPVGTIQATRTFCGDTLILI